MGVGVGGYDPTSGGYAPAYAYSGAVSTPAYPTSPIPSVGYAPGSSPMAYPSSGYQASYAPAYAAGAGPTGYYDPAQSGVGSYGAYQGAGSPQYQPYYGAHNIGGASSWTGAGSDPNIPNYQNLAYQNNPAHPSSFYYNPNNLPANGQNYANTDWGRLMLEQNPQTAYYRQGQAMGVPDDQSAFGRWFRQQYPQFQQGYNAYTISDPVHADIRTYAASLGGLPDWQRQFMNLAPSLRGEDPASRGGGPTRWISR